MARPAPTHTMVFVALTAMTAGRPGPPMMCKSGILRIWFAAARLMTSERLCSLRPATLLTLVSAVLTAENAICLGKLMTQCQLENADASAHGEKPSLLEFIFLYFCINKTLKFISKYVTF